MNKRVGPEAMYGIWKGKISAESIRNLEIGEDLCQKRKPYEAIPYLEKAMEDPRNLDAWIARAFLARTLDDATELLMDAESQGRTYLEKDLGPKCFDDDGGIVGRFWQVLETRPYMRVLQALVRIYVDNKKYDYAAANCIIMLRLCPGDNMGQRYWLPTLLAKMRNYIRSLSYSQVWLEDESIIPDGNTPPSKTPLSARRVKEWSESVFLKADIPYTSALAAFRLWGDCELARQYLLIAARLNPQVLLKILAKVDRPKTLSSHTRPLNGTDDAHDYLWLAQDAWMEQDVWNWANSQRDAKASVMKQCSRNSCGIVEQEVAQFKRCGSCHQVWYCSVDCQKQDWKTHKLACKQYAQKKKWMRAFNNGKPTKGPAPMPGAVADLTENGDVTVFF